MASPDWSEYVDLTVYDKTATEIFNDSIDYGRDLLPEWQPKVGNLETVLLEAIATQSVSVIAAANRVPGAVMETLLLLYGVERDAGQKATATLSVSMINNSGYTVPAGTNYAYFPPDGGKALVFELMEDISVPAGSTTGTGTVEAIDIGSEFNNPPAGSSVQVLSSIPYMLSSSFTTQPSGGTDPESDQDFFTRATTTLRSYSGALTTTTQIESWVLVTFPNDAYRCKVYDRRRKTDRDTTSATYDTHDGYSLVAVAGLNAVITDTGDVPLSVQQLDDISTELDKKTNTGLVTEVVNAQLVDVTVSVQVVPYVGYTTSQITDSINAALNSYLSPNEWDWSDTVRKNEIISLLDNVEGVDYVSELTSITSTSPDTTVTANGDLSFHILGTLPVSTGHSISVLSPE